MAERVNELGQPIGADVPDWTARPRPPRTPMAGRFCRLEPLAPRHSADLFDAFTRDTDGRTWTYMPSGPFPEEAGFAAWIAEISPCEDPLFFAVLDRAGRAIGMASFLRIDPANGVAEVGHIAFSPELRRTPAATEAMYLMMSRIFGELGYRRYEWKCDALNAASRRAAARLGFSYDGLFRQAVVYKGRNRDTAWFSILDSGWPALSRAFEGWLSPKNFGADGSQKERLADLILKTRGDTPG